MAKISKTVVDADLRAQIFECLFETCNPADYGFDKINDRQMGVILVDKNGVERYCRVGVIVAEEREDMTARELMQSEIDAYNEKQASKAEKAKAKEAKIARDKKTREEKAKKEGTENE
jgi:hypothetical protein